MTSVQTHQQATKDDGYTEMTYVRVKVNENVQLRSIAISTQTFLCHFVERGIHENKLIIF